MSAALDRLSELERAATPGSWGTYKNVNGWHFTLPPSDKPVVSSLDWENDKADAALIAAARNVLPALLAVARAAEACESEWTALGALDGPDDLDDDFDALRAALAALDAP